MKKETSSTVKTTKNTKTTVYLPDDLRLEVKKHILDTGETLSKFTEVALRSQLETDASRSGRKRIEELKQANELDSVIKDLLK